MKRPLLTKTAAAASAAAAVPRARPPTPTSFEEALQQRSEIRKRLDEYQKKAKQAMEEALKWGDEEAIEKADYNRRIATSIINDLRAPASDFVEPSLTDQIIYGKEKEKKRRQSERQAHERRLENMWRQLKDRYPKQEGKGSKAPVWQKPRGWIQD